MAKKTNHSAEIEKSKYDERLNEINKELTEKIGLSEEDMNILNILIEKKGEGVVNFWRWMRFLSFFLSILFLVFIYYVFRYLTEGFPVVEESFENIFCPV
tara:strand:+ start:165 stop:464 length:300 start_codon:yes stop_codon:yes gene_type:complete